MLLCQRLQTIIRAHVHSCSAEISLAPCAYVGYCWDILRPAENKPGEVPAVVDCSTRTHPPSQLLTLAFC